MYKIKIDNLKIFIENGATIYDGDLPVNVLNISSVEDANENSLIFIDSKAKNKKSILELTKANFIICDEPTYKEYNGPKKCFIINNNPKLFFAKCINSLIRLNNKPIIHESVVISQNAKIHPSVSIGANCYIGNCQIEEGTIIHPNCSIYDNVIIGKNVIIDSGAVIGSAGFGFVRDKDGIPHQFPQLGGVIIEDNVEIGANTCIDRGSLNNTVIHKGVKIDNLVQIAHNVVIGEYTYIIASTIIAGSVTIGSHCWIATSNILNKVKIGNNVTVGFGANVLKSVKDNTTIMGDPAVEVEKYSKLQYNLKNL